MTQIQHHLKIIKFTIEFQLVYCQTDTYEDLSFIVNVHITVIWHNRVKSTAFFSENPLKFEPPIIIKDKTSYVPIRTIVDYLDGNISFSKRHYQYTITINNTVLKIKQNTKKFSVNNNPKSFKSNTFIYKTRLYAPFHEFRRQSITN